MYFLLDKSHFIWYYILMMMIEKFHEDKWIRLKGITGQGKNKIHEHGDIWLIVWVSPDHNPGKIMLRSRKRTFIAGGDMHFDGRWLDLPTDRDFEVVGIDV